MIEAIAEAVAAKVLAQIQGQNKPTRLLYSMAEAADLMSLSRSTVKNMVRDREIAVVKRGSRVLIHHKEIESWAARNRT